ncbi:hypothetical protein SFRURICE_004911, partial [Spodoptera frugiperda]
MSSIRRHTTRRLSRCYWRLEFRAHCALCLEYEPLAWLETGRVGKEVAHPGIANEYDSTQEKKYYTYYQWVCFVLFFQAIMCYTPKFLWDAFEGGLLRTIVMGLNIGICHPEEKEKKKDAIIDYLMRYER